MTRRILHLTRDFPPRHAGGISTALGGLLEAASELAGGPHHAVISFDGWRPNRGPATTSNRQRQAAFDTPLPTLRAEGPADLPAASAFAAAFRPDVVHVHHALLFDLVAALFPTDPPPVLVTLHVLQFHLSRLRGLVAPTLSDAAEARALGAARAISTPTEAARQLVLADTPHLGERVSVTRLGVNGPPAASAANGGPSPITDTVSDALASNPKNLIYVGRFDHLKGLPDLIDAVPAILAAHPDAQLVIAGGIPENAKADRRWRRQLEPVAAAGVIVLPWLPPSDVRRLLALATHFIAPSHAETCGLTLLEARAAGLRLIASDLGAHREIAPDAAFFAPGAPRALATTVIATLAQDASGTPEAVPPPQWRDVLADWVHFWAK